MSQKIKIGLFGLGNVGTGFYKLLQNAPKKNFEITKIVVKDLNKKREIKSNYLSTNPNDILNNNDIDIVVELIDDDVAAFDILKRSLQSHKPLVTANKKMLAENLGEVYRLQRLYCTPVLYEGAVCGSIPLIKNLETHFAYDKLSIVEGIFNGSTNYILTKMTKNNLEYTSALNDATKFGFAESDPYLDVNGLDSKYKLTIAAAHAFGTIIHPDKILNLGITKISKADIQFAKQQGCVIKLIAKAKQIGNHISCLVAPQLIPHASVISTVDNEFNGVFIHGKSVGLQTLMGKGAGSLPTGLVVLADVIELTNKFSYNYSKLESNNNPELLTNGSVNIHVSFRDSNGITITDFDEFLGGYRGRDYQSMNGWVNLNKLVDWKDRDDLSIIMASGASFKVNELKKDQDLTLA